MLYTPHFLTGAAILKLVPNPVIGVPLALASHFLLDMTPHNDFDVKPGASLKSILSKKNKQRNFMLVVMAIDAVLLILSFFWLLLGQNNYWLVIGGGVGISPDALEQSLLLLGKQIPGLQYNFQWRVSRKYGFISYPVVSLAALWILNRV
ncbi:hypothetical protein A2963_04400 [Candidatus Roizmanbacteria bacterium RIFCSPLOWO2_01_FULL_40_13]|uniref:Uncharacterized protein n=1 Tax=Candidatus Gottesmanbacteria bacterium RIFCSPHIGHO2_01_FULL_39_10 TaxID=1798375 RepID=A0A1F5ZQX7_9BACT|nr:MAG: hypothetical protein A2773_06955 [Candidatus Gottesmanbacteria bacterium RIFCSPHIGHO2_01_FULL_39_10]OGK47627.1 MAG: hypothetical protein A2963_04400 [Candidatus Roizmanbacteria bacterium RIFCSPLOWO2_01_FULL_40_13]